MLYCVYKTTNLINEKEYIGFHKFKESVDDGFINPIKGKCGYHNPKNKKEFGFFFEDSYPDNWIKGNPKAKKKNYYDPDTLICKRFEENEQPIGWIRGLPRK